MGLIKLAAIWKTLSSLNRFNCSGTQINSQEFTRRGGKMSDVAESRIDSAPAINDREWYCVLFCFGFFFCFTSLVSHSLRRVDFHSSFRLLLLFNCPDSNCNRSCRIGLQMFVCVCVCVCGGGVMRGGQNKKSATVWWWLGPATTLALAEFVYKGH